LTNTKSERNAVRALLATLVIFFSGCGEPVMDATDEESALASIEKLSADMTAAEKKAFEEAVFLVSRHGEDAPDRELPKGVGHRVHGKTTAEIMGEAEVIRERLDREARIRELLRRADEGLLESEYAEALAAIGEARAAGAETEDVQEREASVQAAMADRLAALEYIEQVVLYDLKADTYNTVLDSSVPGVEFKLKNAGDRSLARVVVTVYFQDGEGNDISEEEYVPVSASRFDSSALKPNYIWQHERDKFYRADGVPSEWRVGAVRAAVTELGFAEEDGPSSAKRVSIEELLAAEEAVTTNRQERWAAEQREQAEREAALERARVAAEKRREEQRLAEEKAERERAMAARRAAEKAAEERRLAAEKAAEEERLAAERAAEEWRTLVGALATEAPASCPRSKDTSELAPPLADALRWLADSQQDDGSWSAPAAANQVGVTGLALLAFLGAGEYWAESEHREVVADAAAWLLAQQDGATGLFGERMGHTFMYCHAIATLALCEVYQRNGSKALEGRVQSAANYICRARNPYGAWRYDVPPNGDQDTSVSAWMVCALRSAEAAGLEIDKAAYDGAMNWLDEVTDTGTGRVGYDDTGSRSARVSGVNDHFPPEKGEAMTSAALLCRFLLGQDPKEAPIMTKHADLMLKTLPEWDPEGLGCDMYYWYWGTYAMLHTGGESWGVWKKSVLEAARSSQAGAGDDKGSWEPTGPWGSFGGRVYSTALMALCLEAELRLIWPR